jgi:hypothetical protein
MLSFAYQISIMHDLFAQKYSFNPSKKNYLRLFASANTNPLCVAFLTQFQKQLTLSDASAWKTHFVKVLFCCLFCLIILIISIAYKPN